MDFFFDVLQLLQTYQTPLGASDLGYYVNQCSSCCVRFPKLGIFIFTLLNYSTAFSETSLL